MVGWTGGLDANDHIRILRGVRHRGHTIEQAKAIIRGEAFRMKPVREVAVENNAFGKLYETGLRAETGLPIVGHTTDAKKHSFADGVPSLSVMFENGQIILPYANDKDTRGLIDVLYEELHGFGVEPHDDAAMALWILVTRLRQFVGQRTSDADIAAINARGRGASRFDEEF